MRTRALIGLAFVLIAPIAVYLGGSVFNAMGGPLTNSGVSIRIFASSGADDGNFYSLIWVSLIPIILLAITYLRSWKIFSMMMSFLVILVFAVVTFADSFWEAGSYDGSIYPDNRLLIWKSGYFIGWVLLLLGLIVLFTEKTAGKTERTRL